MTLTKTKKKKKKERKSIVCCFLLGLCRFSKHPFSSFPICSLQSSSAAFVGCSRRGIWINLFLIVQWLSTPSHRFDVLSAFILVGHVLIYTHIACSNKQFLFHYYRLSMTISFIWLGVGILDTIILGKPPLCHVSCLNVSLSHRVCLSAPAS